MSLNKSVITINVSGLKCLYLLKTETMRFLKESKKKKKKNQNPASALYKEYT